MTWNPQGKKARGIPKYIIGKGAEGRDENSWKDQLAIFIYDLSYPGDLQGKEETNARGKK